MKFYVQWYEQTEDAASDYEGCSARLENLSRELEGIALERA